MYANDIVCVQFCSDKIVVYGYSETILDFLKSAKANCEVYVCEGGVCGGGERMYAMLKQAKISATLVADGFMYGIMHGASKVLLAAKLRTFEEGRDRVVHHENGLALDGATVLCLLMLYCASISVMLCGD